jgi:hypothetical protein
MQQSYGTRSSGSATLPARLTALGDIMEDAIAYMCSFLLLQEVGRLDMAICSASLRCAFLRSISGDALADLKTAKYPDSPMSGIPVLTSGLGRWLSLRGMALHEYMINEDVVAACLDIFRNTKRLVLPASRGDHPLAGVVLAQTRHTLEELCVYGYNHNKTIGNALFPVLETLRGLNPKISTIEVHSYYKGPDFGKVARLLATHFTDLRRLRLPGPIFGEQYFDAKDIEVILKACSNLESFECDLDSIHCPLIHFQSGELRLNNVKSHSLVHAALQRFGRLVTTLTWTFSDTNGDDDLVLMSRMCSKLQRWELEDANNVTDDGVIRALSSLPHLTSISLSGCDQLTVAGLQGLIESRWPLRYFKVKRDVDEDDVGVLYYQNVLKFDEGVITGNGDLYWPLAEVFTRRQRDTLKAIGDRQLQIREIHRPSGCIVQ